MSKTVLWLFMLVIMCSLGAELEFPKLPGNIQNIKDVASQAASAVSQFDMSKITKEMCGKTVDKIKMAAEALIKTEKILEKKVIIEQNLSKILDIQKNIGGMVKQISELKKAFNPTTQQALIEKTMHTQMQVRTLILTQLQQDLGGFNPEAVITTLKNIKSGITNLDSVAQELSKALKSIEGLTGNFQQFVEKLKDLKLTPEDVKEKLAQVQKAYKMCTGGEYKLEDDPLETSVSDSEESEDEEPGKESKESKKETKEQQESKEQSKEGKKETKEQQKTKEQQQSKELKKSKDQEEVKSPEVKSTIPKAPLALGKQNDQAKKLATKPDINKNLSKNNAPPLPKSLGTSEQKSQAKVVPEGSKGETQEQKGKTKEQSKAEPKEEGKGKTNEQSKTKEQSKPSNKGETNEQKEESKGQSKRQTKEQQEEESKEETKDLPVKSKPEKISWDGETNENKEQQEEEETKVQYIPPKPEPKLVKPKVNTTSKDGKPTKKEQPKPTNDKSEFSKKGPPKTAPSSKSMTHPFDGAHRQEPVQKQQYDNHKNRPTMQVSYQFMQIPSLPTSENMHIPALPSKLKFNPNNQNNPNKDPHTRRKIFQQAGVDTIKEDVRSVKIKEEQHVQTYEPVDYVPPKVNKNQQKKEVVVKQSTTKYSESKTDGDPAASFEFNDKELQDSEEYGYGYWFRYQSNEYKMKPDTYHFLSRLTSNCDYEDFARYGDRTLAIFLVDNIFVFATYDFKEKKKNLANNLIILNEDIESMWYFISFSYKYGKAVGFLAQYGEGNKMYRVEIPCQHVPPFYLKLIIGGKDLHYPGITGMFANIYYDIDAPAFIENEEDVRKIMKELCNPPIPLNQMIEQQVISKPVLLYANSDKGRYQEKIESQLLLEEYAIAGWFRWIDDLKLDSVNTFQIFNLRSTEKKSEGKGVLGDRALEVHYTHGGGDKSQVYFNTYSIEGNKAKGNPYVSKAVVSEKQVWTYVYFGYDTDGTKAYGAHIKPGQADEVNFEIQHKLVSLLHLSIGGDDIVSSFNGKIGYVGVYIGPGSYRTGLDFGPKFQYGDGVVHLFQILRPIKYQDDAVEQNVVRDTAFDQQQPVVDKILIHEDEKIKINGQSEYSFGLWTRWLRTWSKYLTKRANSHNIARLGTSPYVIELEDGKQVRTNQQRAATPQDSTLVATLGLTSYEFYTYDQQEIKKKDIEFEDKLEGYWNYVYFGYKRTGQKGQAKAFVQFGNEGDVKEATFDVLHDFVYDYIEFVVGKSSAPLFNGQLTKIEFSIGPGAFLYSAEHLRVVTKGLLPEKAEIHPIQRKTLQTIGKSTTFPVDEPVQFSFNNYQGAKEYSISGWFKWTGPKETGKVYNIAHFAQRRLEDVDGRDDQTLAIRKSDKAYQFTTYNCEKADCSKIELQEEEYKEYWDQWTFVYYGYSQSLSKTFAYLKYPFSEVSFSQNKINHFYLAIFSIIFGQGNQVGKSWDGFLKTWVLNVGDGAYREQDFDQDEDVKVTFGLIPGNDHIKLQEAVQEHKEESVLDSSTNAKDVIPVEIEFKQSEEVHLNGKSEYGYGFWLRFQLFGKNIIYSQPQWQGISRLTTNKEYKDFSNPGDRVLLVLLGKGFYHFSTYSTDNNNLNGNVEVAPETESEWTYIYFSYKRLSQEQGQAIGWVFDQHQPKALQIESVHQILGDYLLFQVGHAGKFYPNFNGQIAKIRFITGSGAFISKPADLLKKVNTVDTIPPTHSIEPKQLQVIKGKVEVQEAQDQIESPLNIENHEAREYGVQVWFRLGKDQAHIFRLSQQTEKTNEIGYNALSFTHDKASLFETYSLVGDQDHQYKCEIPSTSQDVWTFAYFAYKKAEKKVQYYLKADFYECKDSKEILHLVSQNLHFEVNKGIHGKLAELILNIGDGSFTDKFDLLPSFLAASKLFVKKNMFVYDKDEIVHFDLTEKDQSYVHEITDSESIESSHEYSLGFWVRFLQAHPYSQPLPKEMQLVRLTSNKEAGELQLRDKILSAQIIQDNYQFGTYDLNDQQPNELSLIPYQQLEGQWNYIYLAYKREVQKAKYYAYDGAEYLKEAENHELLHSPIGDYLKLIVGREEKVIGFQGVMVKLNLNIGNGAFLDTVENLKKAVDNSEVLPPEFTIQHLYKAKTGSQEIIGEVKKLDADVTGNELSGDTWSQVGEYSISGWFKLIDEQTVQKDPCEALFRVTNNKDLSDKKVQGDRTLHGQICTQQSVKLSTYTLLGLKDWNEAKFVEENANLGDSRHAWSYIYMGYSQTLQEIHVLIHLFNKDQPIIFKSIQHFVPHFIGIYVGKDPFARQFNGHLLKWYTRYGANAFTPVNKKGYEDSLLFYNTIQTNQKYIWSVDQETVIETPIEHIFTQETESVDEYSFGVWTRWLYGFPTILTDRADLHTIFRLSSTKDYSDKSELGNRVLAAFLGQGFYGFSTYDLEKEAPAVDAKAPYEDIEGLWHYVYCGYKDGEFYGAVLFKESQKVVHVDLKVKHKVLSGYLKLTIAAKEFGYRPFNGFLFDPRVFFGKGAFQNEAQSLINMVLKIHKKLPQDQINAVNFKWPVSSIDTTNKDHLIINKDKLYFTFEENKFITEYSYGFWIQSAVLLPDQEDIPRAVARLTTNDLSIQGDSRQMGDRTLFTMAKSNQVVLSTYNVKDPGFETVSVDLEVPQYQWNFVYFGYSSEKTKGYVLTIKGHLEKEIKAKHIVPINFYLQLLKDKDHETFYGKFQGFQLLFGKGSLLDNPEELIEQWPYKPKPKESILISVNKQKQ